MKVSNLVGAELDRAVSIAHGDEGLKPVAYSTDWQFGGPIIQQVGIGLSQGNLGGWYATLHGEEFKGPTPLIAAMRCYVWHVIGDESEFPEAA